MASFFENFWNFLEFFFSNFKNVYRSDFLSDFKNKISVKKLRLHTFQKNLNFFSCVYFARGTVKIATLHILASLRAKCTQEKKFQFFWKVWNLSYLKLFLFLNWTKTRFCEFFWILGGEIFQNFSKNSKKLCLFLDARTNFEIAYRSEFFSNFKNKISVKKLILHTFQKNWLFFPACILHAVLSKSLPFIFWLVCVQNARNKKKFNFFEKYGISAI